MELPQHLFDYISTITPLVNVELILKDCTPSIVLSWRDDGLYGPGWHLPGGIVRHKESLLSRVREVARLECGITKIQTCNLIQINQIMNPHRDLRGHFISFVFGVTTANQFIQTSPELVDGAVCSFTKVPVNLIDQHQRYHGLITDFLADNIDHSIMSGNLLVNYGPSYES
jgi:colanic acid biosynthesis protein WcaH